MGSGRDSFSDQAQAVRVLLRNSSPVIDDIIIGGRPPGMFGLAPKSHLVPWLSICDGVRAELVGQTLDDAVTRLTALCGWARRLPSMALAGELKGTLPKGAASAGKRRRSGYEGGRTPADWFREAEDHVNGVLNPVRPPSSTTTTTTTTTTTYAPRREDDQNRRVVLVQNLIAAYLHYRNSAPLGAFPVPAVDTAGPPDAASVRGAEFGGRQLDREPAIAALWGLFDEGALAALLEDPTRLLSPKAEHLGAYALADHVYSMEQAYPALARTAGLAESAPDRCDEAARGRLRTLLANRPDSLGPRPGRMTTGADRWAVQLALSFAQGRPPVVERVYVGGRPTGAKGSHTTAWVALCDYTRAVVAGAEVAEITNRLRTAAAGIVAVLARCGHTERSPDLVDTSAVDVAQAQVATFLAWLNGDRLAVVDTGGLSLPANEHSHRQTLRERSTFAEERARHIAGLFDYRCLEDVEPADYAPYLARHLFLAGRAYGAGEDTGEEGDAVSAAGPMTLGALLSRNDVLDEDFQDVCTTVLRALGVDHGYDPDDFRRAREGDRAKHNVKPTAGFEPDYVQGESESDDDYSMDGVESSQESSADESEPSESEGMDVDSEADYVPSENSEAESSSDDDEDTRRHKRRRY